MPGALVAGDHRAALLKARFTKVGALVPETLDIFWAWNTSGCCWETPANPGSDSPPTRPLFKVYVIAGRSGAEAASPVEPTVNDDFAKLILSELNRALFDGDRSSARVVSPPGRSPSI